MQANSPPIDSYGEMDMSTLFDHQNSEPSSIADTLAFETPEILPAREHSTGSSNTDVDPHEVLSDRRHEYSTTSETRAFVVPGLRQPQFAPSSVPGLTPDSARSIVTNPYIESEKKLPDSISQGPRDFKYLANDKHLSNDNVEEYSAGVIYVGGKSSPEQLSKRRLKELEYLKEVPETHLNLANGALNPLSLAQQSDNNTALGYSKVIPFAPRVRTTSNPLCITPPSFWVKTSVLLGIDDPLVPVPDPAQPAMHSHTLLNLPAASDEAAIMQSDRRLSIADSLKAFENTSTSVAASQMRNALNNLADTVEDPKEKKVKQNPKTVITVANHFLAL